jgi:hyaluronan synthase
MQIQSVDDYVLQPLIITLYSIAILTFVMSRFIIAARYKQPENNDYSPSLSILVPCMNEEEVIRQTVERVFAAGYPNDKLEVICVNDGSSDNTLNMLLDSLTLHPNLVVVDFVTNKGLCHGWAVSTLIARGEIMVCVDSDTFVLPGALDKLVQGFADPSVGGVSGHCDVENADANLLTRMQDVRYFFSYKIMKAAESVSGVVSCLPGCFSAYRRVCVLNVLDEWINSKVMGVSGNFADDRSLTNLILRDYKIIYDSRALATTLAPEDWATYIRQQARWSRSYLREVVKVSRWIWRKPPGAALAWCALMWLPLIEPVVLMAALVAVPVLTYINEGIVELPISYLTGLAAITGVWTLDYFARTGRKGWWTGFLYTLTYMAFFCWQVYWALLTLTTKKWGTRNAGDTADETDKSVCIQSSKGAEISTADEDTANGAGQDWINPLPLPENQHAKSWLKLCVASLAILAILIPGTIYYGNMLQLPPEEREWSWQGFRNEVVEAGAAKIPTLPGKTLTQLAARKEAGVPLPFALSYRNLKLGIGPVFLTIVHYNDQADTRLFFEKCDKYEPNGAKKAALALAHGYLSFLYLSKIEETPVKNVQELQALDKVLAALGPSAWLATCIQESFFVLDKNSGYFHLDIDPGEVGGGEWADSGKGFWKYCSFLEDVGRRGTIQGNPQLNGIQLSDPEYKPDLGAFCCSAVLKGYFDAGTWKTLTENDYYSNVHEKVKRLLVNYAMNENNNRIVNIKIPDLYPYGYNYPASQILMRILAWNYNRGRYTDSEHWKNPDWTFHFKPFFKNHSDGKTALEDVVQYVLYKPEQKDLRYPWGVRYIYQIPAIAGVLENYAQQPATRFTEPISLQDMQDYLDVLRPMYPQEALAAGKQTAEKLFKESTYDYDSEKFFDIFYSVTGAVVEAAKQ